MREDFARRESGRQAFTRLKRAVKSHSRLQHEALPRPLRIVEEPARGFFGVLRAYVAGRSLADVQLPTADDPARYGRALATLVGWFAELGELLGWLHERAAIHGNLKPSNVILERLPDRHQVRLLDLSWSAIGLAGPQPGIPSFLSPEQLEGEAPSFASDQWALATMLNRLLGADAREPGTPELPPTLLEHLDQAVQVVPERRFPTIRGFASALRTVQEELVSGERPWGPAIHPAIASRPKTGGEGDEAGERPASNLVHVPAVRPLIPNPESVEPEGAPPAPHAREAPSDPGVFAPLTAMEDAMNPDPTTVADYAVEAPPEYGEPPVDGDAESSPEAVEIWSSGAAPDEGLELYHVSMETESAAASGDDAAPGEEDASGARLVPAAEPEAAEWEGAEREAARPLDPAGGGEGAREGVERPRTRTPRHRRAGRCGVRGGGSRERDGRSGWGVQVCHGGGCGHPGGDRRARGARPGTARKRGAPSGRLAGGCPHRSGRRGGRRAVRGPSGSVGAAARSAWVGAVR